MSKTLADLFRNSRLVDRTVAVKGLCAVLDQRNATPAQIADAVRGRRVARQADLASAD